MLRCLIQNFYTLLFGLKTFSFLLNIFTLTYKLYHNNFVNILKLISYFFCLYCMQFFSDGFFTRKHEKYLCNKILILHKFGYNLLYQRLYFNVIITCTVYCCLLYKLLPTYHKHVFFYARVP